MTFAEIAHAVLSAALAADARPVQITIAGRRVGVVIRDHRVIVEVSGGVLRVTWVGAAVGGGRATKDLRVALDDTDEWVVGAMVRRAVEAER